MITTARWSMNRWIWAHNIPLWKQKLDYLFKSDIVSIQLHTDKNSNLVNIKRPYINRFDYIMLYFQSSICMLSIDSMFLTNTVIKILQKRKEIVCCVKLNTEISTRHSKPLYNVSLIYKKIVTVEEHFLYLTHL